MRLLITLAWLAIGYALQTVAQQTNTPDPQVRDALATLNKKMDDGFVNSDAAALAAMYTGNAVIVSHDQAPVYGRECN